MKKRDWKIVVFLMFFGMSLMPPLAMGLSEESDLWTTYLDSNQGVQVRYPSSWFRKEHSNPPVYQLFLSREKVVKPGDVFLVGISILQIQNASAQLNLKTDDPATAASLLVESYINNCQNPVTKHVVNKLVRVGNTDGYLTDLSTRDVFGRDSHIWLVYLLQDGVLTNIILESPKAEFSKYEPVFHRFLEETNLPGLMQRESLVKAPFRLTREVMEDHVLIKELDLSVSRPVDWIVLQFDDPHHLVTFCRQNPPSSTGPVITASFVARLDQSTPALARAVILEKARLLNESTIMQIGNTTPKKVGAWEGFEETYVFSSDGTSVGFVYFFVPAKDFLYVFTYSNRFESFGEHLKDFNTVIENSRFINGESHIPEVFVRGIAEAQIRVAMERIKEVKRKSDETAKTSSAVRVPGSGGTGK